MGKLVQVATNTVTSAVASVTLTGIDSDDVYMLAINGYTTSISTGIRFRFTVSGTADSTANYDWAAKRLRTDTTFDNQTSTNATEGQFSGIATHELPYSNNSILYLYNLNNSSEYSFYTNETSAYYSTNDLMGYQGGGVHTVAQSCDGVYFFNSSGGNITGGTFTLYKVI